MRRFDNTELWKLLRSAGNASPDSTMKLNDVLDEFVLELHCYCREERNLGERTRALNYARNELRIAFDPSGCEIKKSASLQTLFRQAIYFIDCEIEIIKMELAHPERFITFPADNAPLARWNGKVNDLIEYFIGPQVSGKLLKPSGEPMAYVDAINFIESIFGITISGTYDRKTKVLGRQKNTTFQDEMRRVFLEEAKKMDI